MNTKKYIAESFERLLEKKSFKSITIQDIADESEISRVTFYRNFKDKYDLMNWVYQHELDKFKDSLIDERKSLTTTKILAEFIYLKRKYFVELFKIEGQNSFTNFLAEYSIEFTKKQLEFVFDKEAPENMMDSIVIYCYGCANYLKHWALGGYKKTPEEITKILTENIPEKLVKYLYV